MKIFSQKSLIFIFTGLFLLSSFSFLVYAQVTPTATPTPSTDTSQQQSDLQKKIAELEGKISDLKSQESSLTSQIDVMDSQIKLTEYKIDATKQQITNISMDIDSATKRMASLDVSLNQVTKTLINRIVATYQSGAAEPMQVILASNDISDMASRANYLRLVQEHDKKLLYDTEQARNDYANQKTIFEDKKKQVEGLKTQLETFNTQLDQQKGDKKRLLAETQGDEESYQRLLAAAKAQLAGFSN
ncbi:MAG TPA: hypothetical protein VF810_01880, partial [Patescibacteria group bacterium]